MSAKKYHAYFIPRTRKQGVADNWPDCEKIISGEIGARFKGFRTETEAEEWLHKGADYRKKIARHGLAAGIYFDAGTGRGQGVEISVTDEKGNDLLHEILPKNRINQFGKHRVAEPATNNYGELLACKYALELARKKKIKNVFGDSTLVLTYWSRGIIKKTPQALPLLSLKREIPAETIHLSKTVTRMRREFEKSGGRLEYIPGKDNPADLGFHR